jgi:two-component system sensor histidine kinase CpxA
LIEDLMPDLVFEAEARRCQVIHQQQQVCLVLGSEEVLRRALENVIRNAIRHSPPDGAVVIETLTEGAKEESIAVVRICDSGPGVPEESLQAIFRPFYRVDSARQATTGGFGVGLAIADRAVQIHRGTIQAHNRANGGLCVEFRLPCARSGSALN